MRIEDRIAKSTGEEKTGYEKILRDRKKLRGQITKNWYASLTPEQKAEQARKISAGRKSDKKKLKPGHARGENHYLSKLTEAQVREIYASTNPIEEVAKQYGVSVTAVRNIWTRETWKQLDLPEMKRPDRRLTSENKTLSKKKIIEGQEARISKEIKAEILANPWEDTHSLADRLGLKYFDVATIRLKNIGVYRKWR